MEVRSRSSEPCHVITILGCRHLLVMRLSNQPRGRLHESDRVQRLTWGACMCANLILNQLLVVCSCGFCFWFGWKGCSVNMSAWDEITNTIGRSYILNFQSYVSQIMVFPWSKVTKQNNTNPKWNCVWMIVSAGSVSACTCYCNCYENDINSLWIIASWQCIKQFPSQRDDYAPTGVHEDHAVILTTSSICALGF